LFGEFRAGVRGGAANAFNYKPQQSLAVKPPGIFQEGVKNGVVFKGG
jgi:hypothetical protein